MQRAELALKLKEAVAAEARKRMSAGGGDKKSAKAKSGCEKSHTPVAPKRTDEKLAEMAGVSSNTIRRVEKIIAEAEPEEVWTDAVRT